LVAAAASDSPSRCAAHHEAPSAAPYGLFATSAFANLPSVECLHSSSVQIRRRVCFNTCRSAFVLAPTLRSAVSNAATIRSSLQNDRTLRPQATANSRSLPSVNALADGAWRFRRRACSTSRGSCHANQWCSSIAHPPRFPRRRYVPCSRGGLRIWSPTTSRFVARLGSSTWGGGRRTRSASSP